MKKYLFVLSCLSVWSVFAQTDLRQEWLTVFRQYINLNENLKIISTGDTGKSSVQYQRLKANEDSVHSNLYLPALRKVKAHVMASGDRELLETFLKVLLATSYREDDYQTFALGDMYLAQPDSVISAYQRFKPLYQNTLFKELEKGFMRVSFRNPDLENYEELKSRLLALRPQSPQ
jgi:hypothetical protein